MCSCCVCAILQQCSVSTLSLAPWRHFLEEMHFGSSVRHWCWWSMWSDSESLAAMCSWSDIRTGHHQHCHHHHYQHQHHHTVIVFIINVIIGKQFWESDGSVFIYATQGQKLNDQNFLCFSTFAASSIPFSQRQTSLLFWDIYSPPFLPILLLWENPLSSQKWGVVSFVLFVL